MMLHQFVAICRIKLSVIHLWQELSWFFTYLNCFRHLWVIAITMSNHFVVAKGFVVTASNNRNLWNVVASNPADHRSIRGFNPFCLLWDKLLLRIILMIEGQFLVATSFVDCWVIWWPWHDFWQHIFGRDNFSFVPLFILLLFSFVERVVPHWLQCEF